MNKLPTCQRKGLLRNAPRAFRQHLLSEASAKLPCLAAMQCSSSAVYLSPHLSLPRLPQKPQAEQKCQFINLRVHHLLLPIYFGVVRSPSEPCSAETLAHALLALLAPCAHRLSWGDPPLCQVHWLANFPVWHLQSASLLRSHFTARNFNTKELQLCSGNSNKRLRDSAHILMRHAVGACGALANRMPLLQQALIPSAHKALHFASS